MTDERFDRLGGHSVRSCRDSDRLGGIAGTKEEKGFAAAWRRLRNEFAEASYWSASVGFGLYAAFRIVGIIQ